MLAHGTTSVPIEMSTEELNNMAPDIGIPQKRTTERTGVRVAIFKCLRLTGVKPSKEIIVWREEIVIPTMKNQPIRQMTVSTLKRTINLAMTLVHTHLNFVK
ncbi:hypothetical protein FRB90_008976 [Tulasnella sp. 427]|nr:hypothetical protein FRB90_008976 [Tulasnella sp. 427]